MSNDEAVPINRIVQLDPNLKVAECPCKSQHYKIILKPIMSNGRAELKQLICANCGFTIMFDGDAIIGNKERVYVDKSGKKHHHLDVTPGNFGAS